MITLNALTLLKHSASFQSVPTLLRRVSHCQASMAAGGPTTPTPPPDTARGATADLADVFIPGELHVVLHSSACNTVLGCATAEHQYRCSTVTTLRQWMSCGFQAGQQARGPPPPPGLKVTTAVKLVSLAGVLLHAEPVDQVSTRKVQIMEPIFQ